MPIKRTSLYLVLIILVSGSIVGWWFYARYLKPERPEILRFTVERGSIQETVLARGKVVPQKDIDLAFSISGVLQDVLVKEGQQVEAGETLAKLDYTQFEIEKDQAIALLDQYKAELDKLKAGADIEDIKIYETKVENAKVIVAEKKKAVRDTILDAYTKSDDAVRNKVDPLFSGPEGVDPKLVLGIDYQKLNNLGVTVEEIEKERFEVGGILNLWRMSIQDLNENSDLANYIAQAKDNLDKIRDFLDDVGAAINSAVPIPTISQTQIDTWKVDVSAARANINSAITSLTLAESDLTAANAELTLAKRNLEAIKAPARPEDILVLEAKIKQAENKIRLIEDKISKSILSAPVAGRIAKIAVDPGEAVQPGQVVISFYAGSWKLQADVSELDIGKIKEGIKVKISLDAFPDKTIIGYVSSVDPKEILLDGDVYYRVNVLANNTDSLQLRSGMTADLTFLLSEKDNILKIPELAVFEKDDQSMVNLLDNGQIKEVKVETGISDGEFIEIVSGLKEGQTVLVISSNK